MTDDQIDRILEGLAQVAEKLGESAAHVYGVLVRQAYVEALQFGIWALAFALAAIVLWRGVVPKAREHDAKITSSYEPMTLPWVWGGIGLLAVPTSVCLVSVVSRLINPEYYALLALLEVLK